MTLRHLQQLIPAIETSDGAGVRLRRSLGAYRGLSLDPFLMLDEFSSENPDDYVAGFPSHPHRGFETVTYMLDGRMRHEDHLGNRGDLGPGDVQWMTAARGIIHSEMPLQLEGRMRGFQLWINLPAAEKMKDPGWRDIPSGQIPELPLASGGSARIIAGELQIDGQAAAGAVRGLSTEAIYVDVHLPAQASVSLQIPHAHRAFAYAYEGQVAIAGKTLPHHHAGVLSDGERVEATAGADDARFLLLAGRPLNEPVVQHGPFVMNTREQIEQAIADFRNGRFGQ